MNGIRVVSEHRQASRTIDFYITTTDGTNQLRNIGSEPDGIGEMGGVWYAVKRGEKMPPSLSMPDYLAEEFAKALADTIPPNSSMQRHLDDAVKVRDVLLDLVAKVVRES